MLIIGVTGPSGSGKGAVSKYLAHKGAKIIDADAVYHDLISSPSSCIDELVAIFGKRILTDNGAIDRKKLAPLVFGEENKEKLSLLNKITHKYVIDSINTTLDTYRTSGVRYCVIDAPLLIEADIHKNCDLTVAVLARREIRAERISLRDGIDKNAAWLRINSQKDDSFYTENTDLTVYNDGDIEELYATLTRLLRERGVDL